LADKHPYTPTIPGLAATITQFRKAFPSKVTAETLKKLGIAPNNESYVINILRFIGAIDEEGNRTAGASTAFSKHDAAEFHDAFAEMVKSAYADLFSLHRDDAWTLDNNKLISFFRSSDGTSDVVGRRQAATFQVLANFSGHGELPTPRSPPAPRASAEKPARVRASSLKQATASPEPLTTVQQTPAARERDFGLSVRIEVNLPAAADQETYDRIFRSIRENLLDGK